MGVQHSYKILRPVELREKTDRSGLGNPDPGPQKEEEAEDKEREMNNCGLCVYRISRHTHVDNVLAPKVAC